MTAVKHLGERWPRLARRKPSPPRAMRARPGVHRCYVPGPAGSLLGTALWAAGEILLAMHWCSGGGRRFFRGAVTARKRGWRAGVWGIGVGPPAPLGGASAARKRGPPRTDAFARGQRPRQAALSAASRRAAGAPRVSRGTRLQVFGQSPLMGYAAANTVRRALPGGGAAPPLSSSASIALAGSSSGIVIRAGESVCLFYPSAMH